MNAFAAVSDVNTEGATPLALSPLFSDGAVLQQGMPVPVWGGQSSAATFERLPCAWEGNRIGLADKVMNPWTPMHQLVLLSGLWGLALTAAEPVALTAPSLLYIRRAAAYGFIDTTGKVIVEPVFEEVQPEFVEGRCGVKQNGLWGFIDGSGTVVERPAYEEVSAFSEGLARVKLDGKWGFLDLTGKMAIPASYWRAASFAGGLARVVMGAGEPGAAPTQVTCGFIGKTGAYVIKPDFAYARDFAEARAAVNVGGRWLMGALTGGKWGFIDPAGKTVVPAQFEDVGDFRDGLAPVRLNKVWGYVDTAGTPVIPPQFKSRAPFDQGVAIVEKDGKALLIDKTGKNLLPAAYDKVYPFEGDTAKVLVGTRYGCIDRVGKQLVPPEYDELMPFSEGFAAVRKDWAWGYVDKSGKLAVALQYRKADAFACGQAKVEIFHPKNRTYAGTLAYINSAGTNAFKYATPSVWPGGQYDWSTGYVDGWAVFRKPAGVSATLPEAGMALMDITMQKLALALPLQDVKKGGYCDQVFLEKAGGPILRLRLAEAIGYFNAATGAVIWKPQE